MPSVIRVIYAWCLIQWAALAQRKHGLSFLVNAVSRCTRSGLALAMFGYSRSEEHVIDALRRAMRWSFVRATCLPVAWAGVVLLRKLSIPASLCIGIRNPALFEAHAWIEIDEGRRIDPDDLHSEAWRMVKESGTPFVTVLRV